MVFTINPTTYYISGTRGDSGVLSFQFDRDMDGATVTFIVKKDITTSDDNAYVTKMVTFPTTDEITAGGGGNPNNVVAVILDPADTINIPICTEEDVPVYEDFVWGLKVTKGSTYVETVVPIKGGCYPKFRVYHNINTLTLTVPPATMSFYATTVNINTLTIQPGQVPKSPIYVTMVSEANGPGKQTLAVPLIWGPAIALYQFNTIVNTWQEIDLASFTISSVVINGITHNNYVNNGPVIGSRQLNFTF